MKRVFWIAGENSGDLHASQIIREMRKRHPEIEHYGIGGLSMEEAGFRSLVPFDRFAVMGFVEVAKHLPFFINMEKRIEEWFKEDPPSLVVLVDYPGFNMRIAHKAALFGIPVLYYICPQFWAWKSHRVEHLRLYTKHVASILPFEIKLLKDAGVTCSYVGHPIAEEIKITQTKEEFAQKYNLDPSKKWLGFFPGSRNHEVKRLLPVFMQTMDLYLSQKYEFIVSQAFTVPDTVFTQITASYSSVKPHIIKGDTYSMMKYCDFLSITSGTATLEAAYIGTPFLIVYIAQRMSYELGKHFVKIKRIGLPNIILDRDLAPELIQEDANPQNIRTNIDKILGNPERYDYFAKELTQIHDILGKRSASKNTTALIEKFVCNKSVNMLD
jgi:lipid-A-disaccharide synthase